MHAQNMSDCFDSAKSPNGVEVPCILTPSTSVGFNPVSKTVEHYIFFAPKPSGCGAVI
jgi:hypothetical protein